MSIQQVFSNFHKNIKVETDELREKRDIILEKIQNSLKKSGHLIPELLNQGSYIYGVGTKPLGDVEYDIDVGLDFRLKSSEYDAKTVRNWVYEAIADHTNRVEDRGPCIRIRYVAGYHVDLVIYARYKDDADNENYQLAYKENIWRSSEPKKLKKYIIDSREAFKNTKDSSGSDQLQRVTRYLKHWNNVAIPEDSPDKPFGLATLLLVINYLKEPFLDLEGNSNDLEALIQIVQSIRYNLGRIIINKPTQEFEDVFKKMSESAMENLKERFSSLLFDLKSVRNKNDVESIKILQRQFGREFPSFSGNNERLSTSNNSKEQAIADMNAAIPLFSNPTRPWCHA